MIVRQYPADLFDAAVGRARGTGLVNQGFYMDRFFDFILLSSLMLAGHPVSPLGVAHWFIVLLTLNGAVSSASRKLWAIDMANRAALAAADQVPRDPSRAL